ncbi:MAG: rhodanese-like domain-containing protein [Campylobacterales bacterium]
MLKYLFFIIVTFINLFAFDAFISSDKLKGLLKNDNIVLLDISKKSIYNAGHISGAINVDISNFISKPINTNPEDAQNKEFKNKIDIVSDFIIEKELRSLGINNNSKVIIYDHNTDDGLSNSAYMAFILIYSGINDISILDGGYMSWVFQNQILVSVKSPNVNDGDITIKPNKNLIVDSSYIKTNISDIKLLDARSYQKYFGISKSKCITKYGHIKKASNSFYKDKFYKDYTLRKQEDLDNIYLNGHNLQKYKTIVIYADNMIEASIEWYIIYQEMGFKNAKIYKNSLYEWVEKEGYPLKRFKWE